MRIAFFGLGTMGVPMLQRLVSAGYEVCGFDVSRDVCARLREEGISIGETPRDTAMGADIVITMLPNQEAVENVLFGTSGAAAALRPGALLLEMGTSDACYISDCARRLDVMGIRSMDAPVCRGVKEAVAGQLLVLAGGEASDFEIALPIFSRFASSEDVLHIGPLGTAIRLKLINNYLSMVNMVIAAEGLTFARLAGVDRDMAMRVFESTPAGRGQLTTNFPRKILRGDTTPDFPLRMGLKDITLALKLGSELGAPLFLGAAARQSFALANNWGRGEEDCTSMLNLLGDLSGLGPA